MTRGIKIGKIILDVKSLREDLIKEYIKEMKNIPEGIDLVYVPSDKLQVLDRLNVSEYPLKTKGQRSRWMPTLNPDVFEKDIMYEYDMWEGIPTYKLKINLGKTKYNSLNDIFISMIKSQRISTHIKLPEQYISPILSNNFRYNEQTFRLKTTGMTIKNKTIRIYKPESTYFNMLKEMKEDTNKYIKFSIDDIAYDLDRLKKHSILNKIGSK